MSITLDIDRPIYVVEVQRDISVTGGITEADHKALRQLVHFVDDGPAAGFGAGPYFRETVGGAFWTSRGWYTDSGKAAKIASLSVTRDAQQKPTTEVWEVYDSDGSTVLATLTDAITYSGAFEVSRTRSLS